MGIAADDGWAKLLRPAGQGLQSPAAGLPRCRRDRAGQPCRLSLDSRPLLIPDVSGQLDQQGQVDALSASLQGLLNEFDLLRQEAPKLRELDIERYLQKTANAFQDEADAIKVSNEQIRQRANLLDQGFSPEQADRLVAQEDINREVRARTQKLFDSNEFQKFSQALGLSNEQLETFKKLTAAAANAGADFQRRQVDDQAFAQRDPAQSNSLRESRLEGAQLEAQLNALRTTGNTLLSEEEQVLLQDSCSRAEYC